MEINKNIIIKLLSVLLILSCFFTIANGEVKELNVPEEVLQGDEVTISGLATPNEAVWIGSSYTVSLPVSSDGGYNHEFRSINFPEGEKKVTIRAERIKNMKIVISGIEVICDENNVSVITKVLGVPVTLMKSPSVIKNGVATLSLSLPREVPGVPVPIDLKGEQDVNISGDAADDTTSVNLDFKMALKVIADTNGAFQEKLSTSGVPVGEFRITAGEKSANLRIVSEPTPVVTPTTAPTPAPTLMPIPMPTTAPIVTPPVIIAPTAAPHPPSPVLPLPSHSLCYPGEKIKALQEQVYSSILYSKWGTENNIQTMYHYKIMVVKTIKTIERLKEVEEERKKKLNKDLEELRAIYLR